MAFFDSMGIVWGRKTAFLYGLPLAAIVCVVVLGGTLGVVPTTRPVLAGAGVAWLVAFVGATGSAAALLRGEGSMAAGYVGALATGHVRALLGAVVGTAVFAVGAAVVYLLFAVFGIYSIALGVGALTFLGAGLLIAGAFQFLDVRTATGDGGLYEALSWNASGAIDEMVGVTYSLGRVLLGLLWLGPGVYWLTSAGYPGHAQAAGYALLSVYLAGVVPVWHALAYEEARRRTDERADYPYDEDEGLVVE